MEIYNRDELIERFVDALPVLRALLGLSQSELGDYLGMSRQSFSSIESKKRKMTWSLFLACLFFFYENPNTKEFIANNNLFPEELQDYFNVNKRK